MHHSTQPQKVRGNSRLRKRKYSVNIGSRWLGLLKRTRKIGPTYRSLRTGCLLPEE